VLGWYPITSVLTGAAVVVLAVPEGWVQPATRSMRTIAQKANAVILIGFIGTVLSCQ